MKQLGQGKSYDAMRHDGSTFSIALGRDAGEK
eukprot:COSAG03_NODE_7547_length_902_cov_21.823163_1_plen_31_part_10